MQARLSGGRRNRKFATAESPDCALISPSPLRDAPPNRQGDHDAGYKAVLYTLISVLLYAPLTPRCCRTGKGAVPSPDP